MSTESTEPAMSLDISDIQSVVAVIDYAADQGAFKGWEVINKVAGVRSRLALFLQAVSVVQETTVSDVAAETAAADDENALAPGA